MKIDESVRITGGKSKKCEGVITSLMNTFILVRITKDKKGVPVFSDKPTKVKKTYIEIISPPINENNVKEPALSMDDAMNLKEENWKLKTQLSSMLSFQGEACKEVADLKWLLKDLQEQLDDSVRKVYVEELKDLINKL